MIPKIKRIKLTPIPRLKKQLDDLASKVVRKIWETNTGGWCAFNGIRSCGNRIECCFHFIKKSRSTNLRYELLNMVGSCMACNGYMEIMEAPFWVWYTKMYGQEAMAQLERDSHKVIYASRSWLEEKKNFLVEELERINRVSRS